MKAAVLLYIQETDDSNSIARASVRFWLSTCWFLLGCCFALQARSFAKAKSGAFTREVREAEDFAKAKRSAKQSPRALMHVPRIVDT